MTESEGDGTLQAASVAVPLIGRAKELGEIVTELDRVLGGQAARAVLVVGATGVGKSRLVSEVVAQAEPRDVQILRGKCVGRGAEPLLPVRDALSDYLGSTPERIKQVLTAAAPQLLGLVPFVGRFLAPMADAVAAGPKLGGSSVDGVYAGLESVFHGLAERSGLCLAIEDIHDADQDTLYFLKYLLEKATGTKALAVFSLDGDELVDSTLEKLVDDWVVQGWTRIDLGVFAKEDVGEYVTAISQAAPSQDVVNVLYDLTGGNPLLIKEMLPLVPSGTATDLAVEISELPLPQAVRALLRRRVANLDEELTHFLDVSSVCLDTTYDFGPVAPALKVDEDAAYELLDKTSRLGLLTEAASGQVRFVHETMRLAVYREVPEASRRRLHAKVGEWHDANGNASGASHHFGRAGRTDDLVRTALQAASLAEHVGMYHSALSFYEQAHAHRDGTLVGTPLARVLLMLGQWDKAESLLRGLPAEDPAVRLVLADLHFVRGNIRAAAEEIAAILPSAGPDRFDCLTRLADIHLYLGEFATASQFACDALEVANQTDSDDDRARGLGLVGAMLFFGGDIDAAKEKVQQAYELLEAVPQAERNRTRYTVILGNLGQIAEVQGKLAEAERFYTRALDIRREVYDARGVLQSLHALARVQIGGSDAQRGVAPLTEADHLASSLGEPLESAKIALTWAKLAQQHGDLARAMPLAENALQGFIDCGTAFDVTHARLALSQMYAEVGDVRRAISHAAQARETIDRKGFGLLTLIYPEVARPYPERIAAALYAYAGGDAFGLPWEGTPPAGVDVTAAQALPPRTDWERGATSDDTALTLLVAEVLLEGDSPDGQTPLAGRFLDRLNRRADDIPGLGPSTLAAVGHYRESGELPVVGGDTNGAAMRILPVGWLVPVDQPDRRRAMTVALSRATHPSPEAQCAACVMSACASWALEGAGGRALLSIAREESAAAVDLCGADPGIVDLLAAVDAGEWSAGSTGVSLDPYDTVAAVLSTVATADALPGALEAAIGLGGDTDTVAALVGGLVGARLSVDEIHSALPWMQYVRLPEDRLVRNLAGGLASARLAAAHD